MGAGKSTIGRLLAAELSRPFYDSDHAIQDRCGADIPWIFDVEGEEGFRDREEQVVQEMTNWDDTVLATGGGVIVREGNRQVLAERGFVVYLYATLDEQVRRTRKNNNRPLLQGDDPEATLRDLMAVRDPLYREIADHVIDTDESSPKTVAHRLLKELRAA
jgi:shikimate kinase